MFSSQEEDLLPDQPVDETQQLNAARGEQLREDHHCGQGQLQSGYENGNGNVKHKHTLGCF